MNRFAITLGTAIALAVWGDAQHSPLAVEHASQYRENRALLTNLVDHTVELANATEHLKRAEACHRLMTDLHLAMGAAVNAGNAPRVAELGDHLAEIVETALAPSISSAGMSIPKTSLNYPALVGLHVQAQQDLDAARLAVPVLGSMGTSQAVKDACARIANALKALKAAL